MALTSSLQQAHEWQSTCQTSSFMGGLAAQARSADHTATCINR